MKLFETLLGRVLGDTIAETDWWADAVFRALEQDRHTGELVDIAVAAVQNDGPANLH